MILIKHWLHVRDIRCANLDEMFGHNFVRYFVGVIIPDGYDRGL